MSMPLLVSDDLARFRIHDGDEITAFVVMRGETSLTGHTSYSWNVRHRGKVIAHGEDLVTGAHMDPGPLAMLCTFIAFLEAAGEAYAASMRGRHTENLDMFPEAVNELAYRYAEQLEFFRFEHEEN